MAQPSKLIRSIIIERDDFFPQLLKTIWVRWRILIQFCQVRDCLEHSSSNDHLVFIGITQASSPTEQFGKEMNPMMKSWTNLFLH